VKTLCFLVVAFVLSLTARGVAEKGPSHADLNPVNDADVGPPDVIDDCFARLERAHVEFSPGAIPVHDEGRGLVCGAEQVVVYKRGPAGLRWNASPVVSCGMALALADFERVVVEESRALSAPVVRVEQGGTYNCRKMARYDWVSEHSYANAIDIRSFTLKNGRRISVEQDFGKLDREPKTREGQFLRSLAHRLYDDAVFSVVLTRFFDELHRDHFHLDLARYRVDGTRPGS
jgi:hypothetical protein